jgi:hypothetical protein
MKRITFLLVLFSISSFFGKDLELRQPYTVISESFDAKIPADKSRLSGTVYYGYSKEEALIGARVYLDDNTAVITDQEGHFSLEVPQTTELALVRYLDDIIRLDKLQLKAQHHYRLEVFFPVIQDIMFKPVIYAYSEQPLDARLNLLVKGELTFTYPQLADDGWSVTTQENGMLKDAQGRFYPYLFWEGESENRLGFKMDGKSLTGNFVKRDSVLPFLESTLGQLGLNDREKTDFITFWAPRMVKHKELFVQFLIDEDYDRIATLEISPQPDHIRRVYLLFRAVESGKTFEYDPQEFSSFERSGFTVLEWGGSELKRDEL